MPPSPLRVAVFSYWDAPSVSTEIAEACSRADLVITLGGVNLDVLSGALDPRQPALAVLGPKDEPQVPRPFRPLHANGFVFRGWRVAGLSGAPRLRSAVPGNYMTEQEAEKLLGGLAPCDLLVTHAPPANYLQQSAVSVEMGFDALATYLREKPPIYHFYAHTAETVVEAFEYTAEIGVCGFFGPPEMPDLEFV